MSTPGDALLNALNQGYGMGSQMLHARQQNAMRQLLGQIYQPPSTQTQNLPVLDAQGNPQVSYISNFQGTGLPIASQNVTTQIPGGFDWQKGYQLASQQGVTPEMMQLQMSSPDYAFQKMAQEYALKQQFQRNIMADFMRQLQGGQLQGGGNPYTSAALSMGINPTGPEMNFDPYKAMQAQNMDQKQALEAQNFFDTHGYYAPGSMPNVPNMGQSQPSQAFPVPSLPSGAGLAPAQQRAITEQAAKTKAEGLAKRELEMPKDLTSLEDVNAKTDQAIDAAKAVLNSPGFSKASGMTYLMGSIPGTEAYDTAQKMNTLKGQIMLSVLQSFRNASANGSSGFGQLSNAEGDTLRNSVANLERAQSTPELKKALENVVQTLQGSQDRMKRGYKRLYGQEPDVKTYHTNPNAISSQGTQGNTINFSELK